MAAGSTQSAVAAGTGLAGAGDVVVIVRQPRAVGGSGGFPAVIPEPRGAPRGRGRPRTGRSGTGTPGSAPREAAPRPYRAASGAALSPCARTLRNTVAAMTATASSAPGPMSSRASSPKTSDASPPGPNQPTNRMVRPPSPLP